VGGAVLVVANLSLMWERRERPGTEKETPRRVREEKLSESK